MQPTTSGETARKLSGDGRSIIESSRRIAKETLDLLGNSVVEVFNNRALYGSPAETLRVLSAWKPTTDVDRVARSMVLLTAYRSEQSSPCSSHLFLRLMAGERLSACEPRAMIESDLPRLLSHISDPTVESLLIDSISEAGASSNISVSTGAITHISVDESVSFPILVSPSFRNAYSLTARRLIAYDAVVESVGQVNELLVKCAEEKASVMFLARAFSQDVASTIFANNQRGVFDIVPATPGTSINDEFTLSDLAAILGQKTTTVAKLESDAQHEMLVENSSLKIRLRDPSHRDELVKQLREEMRQFSDYDVAKLLSERVRRVSSRRVSVCFGEEFGSAKEVTKERFDHGMRSFVSARRKGVIEVSGEMLPGDSLQSARNSFEAFVQLVRNTGGVLVIDKKLEVAKRRSRKTRRA